MRTARLASAATLAVALAVIPRVSAQQSAAASPSMKPLDYEFFKTQVQPVFLRKREGLARCVACHVGRTGFQLTPMSPGATNWNEEQSRKNYEVVSVFVLPGQPAASRLLMHPLAVEAGGDPYHGGGRQFPSRNAADWQTLAKWVNSGGSTTVSAAQSLDFEFYKTRVEPIFLNPRQGGGAAGGGVGCFACHTIMATPLRLQPFSAGSKTWTEEQSRRNFEAAASLVTPGEPLKSRLLLQPLATEAGGSPRHTGGKFWKSQDDPEAQILSEWIRRKR